LSPKPSPKFSMRFGSLVQWLVSLIMPRMLSECWQGESMR